MNISDRLILTKKILSSLEEQDSAIQTESITVGNVLDGYICFFEENKKIEISSSGDEYYKKVQSGAISLCDAVHADATHYVQQKRRGLL